MRVDLRFVGIEYELWAAGRMLEAIEPTIADLARQDERKTLASLEAGGWPHESAEVDLALQDIRELRTYVLPRFVRSPFVVSLWSCYESGVASIAQELGKYMEAQLRLEELRGPFLSAAARYFEAGLGVPLEDSADRLGALRDLSQVRNAIAHSNGLREAMSEGRWKSLGEVVAKHGMTLDTDRGMLIPTADYLEEAYDDVGASLRALVARARLRATA